MPHAQTTAPVIGRPLLLATGIALGCLSASASSIVDRSPFLPPGAKRPAITAPPPPASADQSQLQFKGVFALNDELRFNLFDGKENRGSWVRMNELFAGAKVVAFDQDTKAIDIEINGRVTRFTIIEGSDAPLAVAVASSPALASTDVPLRPTIRGTNDTAQRAISRRRIVPPNRGPARAQNSRDANNQGSATNAGDDGGQGGSTDARSNQLPPVEPPTFVRPRRIIHESN